MKRLALLIPLALAIAASGAVAAAPDGDEAASPIAPFEQGIASAVTALVVFAIVFAILATAVWPKITKGLDERNEKIKNEIATAEDARRQAKEALDEYEKNLAEARAESQRMIEETKSQQAELASQLRAKNEAELTEMRERAMADIESAKKQALSELYAESVNLATAMAGKILQREVKPEDEQRLMDESLAEMKSASV